MIWKKRWGLALGVLALLITMIVPSPTPAFGESAWMALGLMTLMGCWWLSEGVPVPVTALMPLVVAPILELAPAGKISASYAHPLIFLFLGGFMLSLAMERSELHRRIARRAMLMVGDHPRAQVGGVMAITAFLSMWMSNTATAVMMVPIVLSILHLMSSRGGDDGLAPAMLLGVAYGASIGGIATLIGTPPNALLAAYLQETYGVEITFDRWMLFALPFSLIFLLLTWAWLTRNLKEPRKVAAESVSVRVILREQLHAMGPLSKAEKRVAAVFAGAALCWVFRAPLVAWSGWAISDTSIAMIATLLLFLLPAGKESGERLMTWEATRRLPWGVLLLFGGGLALAQLIRDSGLADGIGHLIGSVEHLGPLWLVAVVIVVIVFLTEVTSNTATAAGFLPLLGPIAVASGLAPTSLVIPAAMAASCAFMMPVATPPNAIVFGSEKITMGQMVRAGFVLNLVGAALLFLFAWILVPLVFG